MNIRIVVSMVGILLCSFFLPCHAVVIDSGGVSQELEKMDEANYYKGIGRMHSDTGMCTATPISRNTVLTAAHCTRSTTANFYIFYEDEPNVLITVVRFVDHPSFVDSDTRSNPISYYKNDISVGLLAEPLPDHVPIYKIANYSGIDAGQAIQITGYGLNGNYGKRLYSGGQFNWGLNELSGFANGNSNFYVNMNNTGLKPGAPCDKECQLNGGPGVGPNNRFGIQEALIAPGDSGGPAFTSPFLDASWTPELPDNIRQKLTSDVPELIGVNSYGGSNYFGQYGPQAGFVNVWPKRQWISDTVKILEQAAKSLISNTDFSYGAARKIPAIPYPNKTAMIPEPNTSIKEHAIEALKQDIGWHALGNAFQIDYVNTRDNASMKSNAVSDSEVSELNGFINGPASLKFCWMISSQKNGDSLEFLIDGVVQRSISGKRQWRDVSVRVPEGNHLISWRYIKDNSVSEGEDAGWIDNFRIKE